MFEKLKNVFRKKTKPKNKIKIKKEDPLVLTEDITYENEVKKNLIKETKETKSSLTFGK